LPPDGDEEAVVVVVVVVGAVVVVVEVSLSSSSVSCASSDETVDCAEDTASDSEVVSSVPSDSPAVTCSPTVAVTVATWPATWNEAVALLTGSTVPTTSWVWAIDARVTTPIRYPESPEPLTAQAVAPPIARTATITTVPIMSGRRRACSRPP
jgi:hypothetical protein